MSKDGLLCWVKEIFTFYLKITTMNQLANMRKEYGVNQLSEDTMHAHPVAQFSLWFEQATAQNPLEANAMTLSTVDSHQQPQARIVLLKEYDESGFVFFGNYLSEKAHNIEYNPQVCLSFFWGAFERQVRILGKATRLEQTANHRYFASRPRGSQLGAWASHQSQPIANRDALLQQLEAVTTRYADQPIDCPAHWGGWCVAPSTIEFWQGGAQRVHDRLRYQLIDHNTWQITRLQP